MAQLLTEIYENSQPFIPALKVIGFLRVSCFHSGNVDSVHTKLGLAPKFTFRSNLLISYYVHRESFSSVSTKTKIKTTSTTLNSKGRLFTSLDINYINSHRMKSLVFLQTRNLTSQELFEIIQLSESPYAFDILLENFKLDLICTAIFSLED